MTDTVTVTLRTPFDSRTFQITGSSRDESIPSSIQRMGGYYEPEVMLTLKRVIRPDAVCLDIGANLGTLSLVMSSLAKQGKVFAFEPVPETFNFLVRNTSGAANIEPINAGCFSAAGKLEFHYVEEYAGGSFLSPSGISDHREKKFMVDCVTLDSFLADRGISRVGVIKIDVEGAEDDVLAGAENLCKTNPPPLIIEFNPATSKLFFNRDLQGLYQRLVGWNYQLWLIERPSGALLNVASYAGLMEMIERQSNIGDVLCVPG